jgi:hypothetical protein
MLPSVRAQNLISVFEDTSKAYVSQSDVIAVTSPLALVTLGGHRRLHVVFETLLTLHKHGNTR